MTKRTLPAFEDWESQKLKDSEFVAAAEELEPGYQVARLRMLRGLTQTELAKKLERINLRLPDLKMGQAFRVYLF